MKKPDVCVRLDTSQFQLAEDIVQGAYLEGDVRIVQTPPRAQRKEKSENRLDCERAYYEFATERAVLTDAVIHTVEPRLGIPIIVRAGMVRQLSNGEYRAQNAELTTSSFSVPSYSVSFATMGSPASSVLQSAIASKFSSVNPIGSINR